MSTTDRQSNLLTTQSAADAVYQAAFARFQRTGTGVDKLLADAARRDRQLISGMVDAASRVTSPDAAPVHVAL